MHRAFLRALEAGGSSDDAPSAEQSLVLAGLALLRLVSEYGDARWQSLPAHVERIEAIGSIAAREPERDMIADALSEAIEGWRRDAGAGSEASVIEGVTLLIRYADALAEGGRSALAADAYATALRVDPGLPPQLLLEVNRAYSDATAVARQRPSRTPPVAEPLAIDTAAPSHVVTDPRILAAFAIEDSGDWANGAIAYERLLNEPDVRADERVTSDLHRHIARCRRMLADWDGSRLAAERAETAARMAGDGERVLQAHLALASIPMDRGELQQAEELIDAVANAAEVAGFRATRAWALRLLAGIAGRRSDPITQLRRTYEAMPDLPFEWERDRALHDLGATLNELGFRAAARDAFLVASASASEQVVRSIATINLMHVAAHDGYELAFDRYRSALLDDAGPLAALPPRLAAQAFVVAGEGLWLLGRNEAARDSLMRGRALAEQHDLADVRDQASESLRELDAGVVPKALPAREPSEDIGDIVRGVRALRLRAGVHG